MAKKESSWVTYVLGFFSGVVDKIVEHSDAKIEEIKRKAVHYVIVYGLFTVAMFFMIIGLIKYMAELGWVASEGISFMVVGSILVVLLAIYSMIKRV
jgi:uncharacterized membrane protein